MVFKFQWKPFWLATKLKRDPQNDWTATPAPNRVNYDVFAQAPSVSVFFPVNIASLVSETVSRPDPEVPFSVCLLACLLAMESHNRHDDLHYPIVKLVCLRSAAVLLACLGLFVGHEKPQQA